MFSVVSVHMRESPRSDVPTQTPPTPQTWDLTVQRPPASDTGYQGWAPVQTCSPVDPPPPIADIWGLLKHIQFASAHPIGLLSCSINFQGKRMSQSQSQMYFAQH